MSGSGSQADLAAGASLRPLLLQPETGSLIECNGTCAPGATGLARDIHPSRCEHSMRVFVTSLDRDQYREPAHKHRRLSDPDFILTRIASRTRCQRNFYSERFVL
jgi:hypothetical protein